MIYVKSFLAGVGALIVFYLLFVTVGIRLLVRRPPDLPAGVGYISGPPWWFPSWLLALIALLVFTGACLPDIQEAAKLKTLREPAERRGGEAEFSLKSARVAGRGAKKWRNPPVQPRFGGQNLRVSLKKGRFCDRAELPVQQSRTSRHREHRSRHSKKQQSC